MIKKFAACMLCALLCLVILTACDDEKNAEIVGIWIPTTARINGTSVQYSSLDIGDDQFGFTFNADGSCVEIMTGITMNGTYVFNGTSVDLTINGENQKLDYDAGTLTLTLDYGNNPMQITFTKER